MCPPGIASTMVPTTPPPQPMPARSRRRSSPGPSSRTVTCSLSSACASSVTASFITLTASGRSSARRASSARSPGTAPTLLRNLPSMNEQFCDVGGGIRLCYETFGDPADPALLLIMGLGTQMVAWQEDFCARLVDEGFFVTRYDNRDIGRS